MMFKICVLSTLLAVVCAEPLRKSFSSNDVFYYNANSPSYEVISQPQPQPSDLILTLLNTVLAYKSSALSIAINIIQWISSNLFTMALGSTGVLGYCKLIGCNFNYQQYIPVTQIQALATPENLESAEKFLVRAIEQYSRKKRDSNMLTK